MDNLTKNAKYLLSSLYGNYLIKIKQGNSKMEAVKFGSAEDVHQNIMEKWNFEDVKFTIDELDKQGFVVATPGSNSYLWVNLTPKGIACSEQKLPKDIKAIFDYALKIIH